VPGLVVMDCAATMACSLSSPVTPARFPVKTPARVALPRTDARTPRRPLPVENAFPFATASEPRLKLPPKKSDMTALRSLTVNACPDVANRQLCTAPGQVSVADCPACNVKCTVPPHPDTCAGAAPPPVRAVITTPSCRPAASASTSVWFPRSTIEPDVRPNWLESLKSLENSRG
jgi:hypothetical protein